METAAAEEATTTLQITLHYHQQNSTSPHYNYTIQVRLSFTYAQTISHARQDVRIRETATGARILEVPDAASDEKADRLASRLREVLGDDVAVARPTKCVELRISDLDDSVRVGAIATGADGRGAVVVRCPIVVAKAVVATKFRVGWSTAHVRVLEPLPMRCYRCMGIAHVGRRCPVSLNRSNLCYRCGKPGHRAAGCQAEPKCAVCADLGRPAAHIMGEKACRPPPMKAKETPVARPPPQQRYLRLRQWRKLRCLLMDRLELNFLQVNPNHCARAQDLFVQSMPQWSVDVAVAADPYYVPRHSNWAGDMDGVVVIVTPSAAPPLVVKERGAGYVVAVCGGGVAVVGVYFSLNRPMAEFEPFLLRLSSVVRRLAPANILVMGDLNAKSAAWGSCLPNAKGRAVQAWVTANGLVVANRDTANTCVRRWGGSIVDITFATPTLASQVQDWRVLEGEETLSDHVYIRFRVSSSQASTTTPARRGRGREGFLRWALAKFDAERTTEAAIVAAWGASPQVGSNEMAVGFRRNLTAICDAAMPRSGGRPPKKREVYWWTHELALLRSASNTARFR
ncbi:uncharacterized protein LOC113235887 [Hyposmocoma kahamanoa]|uniref:uncharacterized protein LOC113235887 n=1 Tax=Hyposmocoma kahamanoa TaxID=1477025 RepID=UPI000E6D87B2|nr:uncharacterized protein LOC113235887 [Hyposmocoma kahamanoa]